MYSGDEEDDEEDDLDGPTGKRAAEDDDDEEVRKIFYETCFQFLKEQQPRRTCINKVTADPSHSIKKKMDH